MHGILEIYPITIVEHRPEGDRIIPVEGPTGGRRFFVGRRGRPANGRRRHACGWWYEDIGAAPESKISKRRGRPPIWPLIGSDLVEHVSSIRRADMKVGERQAVYRLAQECGREQYRQSLWVRYQQAKRKLLASLPQ
jgi:hypothetical protein